MQLWYTQTKTTKKVDSAIIYLRDIGVHFIFLHKTYLKHNQNDKQKWL